MIGQSVGSDASPLSCFLFRPRKSCEKRKKRSHTNVSNASATRASRVSQTPLQAPFPTSINGYHAAKKFLSQWPAKRSTFAFAGESGYTLAFANRIAHSGLHAETWGFTLAIGGAFRSHSHIEAMKSRRKRMHALWRVSASYGAAAPLGCAASSAIWRCCFFSLCVRYFLHVRGEGWYHYPQRALRAAETPDGRLSKRLICYFLGLTDSSLIPAAQNIIPFSLQIPEEPAGDPLVLSLLSVFPYLL